MTHPAEPLHAERPASGLRTLIVDDDHFARLLLRDMLADAGWADVHEAEDGHRALQLLDAGAWQPQFVLCDLRMPGMDGIEFLRHLASRRFAGEVCLLSGTHRPVLEAARRLAGAHHLNVVGILEKPFTAAALAQVLVQVLAQMPAHTAQTTPAATSSRGRPRSANHPVTVDELRHGIAHDLITLHFQPKVTVQGRHVVGAECLARFQHPQRGLLGPAAFVPLAEKHGLIDDLTIAVLQRAAKQLASWYDSARDFKLSVNVSMLNLHRLDVPETFEHIVREAGMQPSDFVLEITESALPRNYVVGLDILLRLRLKGFLLSLDDFGTGFSTMQSLSQLPFSELKLDQQFVRGAVSDVRAMAILESSMQLGHALKLDLVAEGVETGAEWALVAQLGCDQVQGYHVARPLPAAELQGFVRQWEGGLPPPASG